jgi:aldose 1-epimerase
MPFAVSIQNVGAFSKIILEETNCSKAEIFSFGALLNYFSIRQNEEEVNVIDGYENVDEAVKKIDRGFWSAKLSPFVCRVENGEYIFENKKHKIDKFYLGKEAIHGLIYDAHFSIKSSGSNEDAAFATLEYLYNKAGQGFPFVYKIEVKYELRKNHALNISTTIVNAGVDEMPLADGWHPYFKFGEKVDDLRFQMNAEQMIEFDHRLLPTGKLLPFDQFISSKKLGSNHFDHCFLLKQNPMPACVLSDDENKITLKILPENSYPYLQIYTPDDRKTIAIENLSSTPDSFNNGMGLIVLKPNESKHFATTFQLSSF